LRISEALSVRVGDDGIHSAWDEDAAVIRVRTGIWKGHELDSPKTRSSIREVDIHSEVNEVLQAFAANMNRSDGNFLFAGRGTSRPITDSVIRANLRSAGASFSLHGFRRFRISHLRRMRCQEDLVKLWAGHAPGSMTDHYVRLADDIEFRKKTVSQVGLGFEFPDRLLTMVSCDFTPMELIPCSPEMETLPA
jgi:integrase